MAESNSISAVERELPPGFRFHPRDEELIWDYLRKRVTCSPSHMPSPSRCPSLIQVDLNKCEPWDLPEMTCVGGKEWYFYSHRDRKYATGHRTNRATNSGYWKATGKDRAIHRKGALVGMRKTLVFHKGRAPKGKKTNWVMHEFRLEESFAPSVVSSLQVQEDEVLCRVFCKSKAVEARENNKESCSEYHQDDTISSSLPPLMDDSYIAFDQSQSTTTNNNPSTNDYHHQESKMQVPCFSIIPSEIPAMNYYYYPVIGKIEHPPPNSNSTHGLLIPPKTSSSGDEHKDDTYKYNPLDTLPCDNDAVLKSVLSELTKVEASSFAKDQSTGAVTEGGGSLNYLSQSDLSTILWTDHQY